jgi:hypothetical protein
MAKIRIEKKKADTHTNKQELTKKCYNEEVTERQKQITIT